MVKATVLVVSVLYATAWCGYARQWLRLNRSRALYRDKIADDRAQPKGGVASRVCSGLDSCQRNCFCGPFRSVSLVNFQVLRRTVATHVQGIGSAKDTQTMLR